MLCGKSDSGSSGSGGSSGSSESTEMSRGHGYGYERGREMGVRGRDRYLSSRRRRWVEGWIENCREKGYEGFGSQEIGPNVIVWVCGCEWDNYEV
jgi:hypothetical protein